MFGLDFDAERLLHYRLSVVMMLLSVAVFATLSSLPSSSVYGKNSNQPGFRSLGYLLQRYVVPPRIAWLIFESPPLLWAGYCYFNTTTDEDSIPNPNRLLLGLFFTHYLYRAMVYPLLISKKAHSIPLLASVSAFVFCFLNGYLQARGAVSFQSYPKDFWQRPQVILGLAMFLFGFLGVMQSDFILSSLRSDGQSGYKIPYGGWFRFVSCPHFSCEILEWVGYAIVSSVPQGDHASPRFGATNYSNGVAAWAFVLFTCANLIPRALSHHSYYLQHFKEDYPPLNRKAIIPFII